MDFEIREKIRALQGRGFRETVAAVALAVAAVIAAGFFSGVGEALLQWLRSGGATTTGPAPTPPMLVPSRSDAPLRWNLSVDGPDPARASATLADMVRAELPSSTSEDAPREPIAIALRIEGSERTPPLSSWRTYEVRVRFSGLAVPCETTARHEETRTGPGDPAFSPVDFEATAKAIVKLANIYVSSGGRSCS